MKNDYNMALLCTPYTTEYNMVYYDFLFLETN